MPPIESLEPTAEETAEFEAVMREEAPPEPEKKPEAQPEPEKKAEEPPKAQEQPKPEPEKPVRLVPHQALHEERERRKALENRLAELEKGLKPQPTGDEPPDEEDLVGTIAWLRKRAANEAAQRDEQTAQQRALQELGQKVQSRVDAYAAEHPEYVEQVQYLRSFRLNELKALGYDMNSAVAQVQQEEIALGKMAIDKDLDPGKIVSDLATVRGWKAKEPEPAKQEEPPKQVAKPNAEAEAKIERLQKGQKAAVSPSSAGGGGPEPEFTLEQLSNLEGAAFDKAWKAHAKRLMA